MVQTWSKHRSTNQSNSDLNMGRHLGIDFWMSLVDLGTQVGRQNRAKIDHKWHRKNDKQIEAQENCKKVAIRNPNRSRSVGSRALGRSPPNRVGQPNLPPKKGHLLSFSLSSPHSLLSFLFSPLSSLLSPLSSLCLSLRRRRQRLTR